MALTSSDYVMSTVGRVDAWRQGIEVHLEYSGNHPTEQGLIEAIQAPADFA